MIQLYEEKKSYLIQTSMIAFQFNFKVKNQHMFVLIASIADIW